MWWRGGEGGGGLFEDYNVLGEGRNCLELQSLGRGGRGEGLLILQCLRISLIVANY